MFCEKQKINGINDISFNIITSPKWKGFGGIENIFVLQKLGRKG